jgi:hypothetical protein
MLISFILFIEIFNFKPECSNTYLPDQSEKTYDLALLKITIC